MLRYFRLLAALARYGLARELTFRGNLVAKVFVEILWLTIMLVFYHTLFRMTENIAGWTEGQYLFFVGCFMALSGIIETFFMSNCSEFAELVRSGDLDFLLLRPIDEQFLLTCRSIDWSTFGNILLGFGIMGFALRDLHLDFDLSKVASFAVLFLCGVGLAYSFLVLLMSSSVWLVRNQSLYEMWWLFTTLMRYPRNIFDKSPAILAQGVGIVFTFVVPVLLILSVPADLIREPINWPMAMLMLFMTVVLFGFSRWFFRRALRRYRSASS
jgi:ABC-2 type transport system permease protein